MERTAQGQPVSTPEAVIWLEVRYAGLEVDGYGEYRVALDVYEAGLRVRALVTLSAQGFAREPLWVGDCEERLDSERGALLVRSAREELARLQTLATLAKERRR